MRFSLFQDKPQQSRLLWTCHHSILDGWSVPIVLKEIQLCYHNLTQKKPKPLPAISPYRHYIEWLSAQKSNDAETFWRHELKDVNNYARSINQVELSTPITNEARQLEHSLSTTITKQLQHFAKNHQVTLHTLLQGTWAYLLYSHSGNSNVMFGETLSGRRIDLPGVENMVGLLINTLPIGISINKQAAIGPWLREIQHAQNQREHYSYLPLPDIQQCSELEAGSPLFSTMIAFQIDPMSMVDKNSSLNIVNIICDEQTHYDLTLTITSAKKTTLQLKYFSQSYSDTAVKQLLNFVVTCLSVLVKPEIKHIIDLPLFPQQTFNKKLDDFSTKPSQETKDKATVFTEPTSLMEIQLVDIWAQALEIPKNKISIHDNFFSLGAHSIIVIQVISRLHKHLTINIGIEDIFDKPTAFQLAEHIEQVIVQKKVFEHKKTDTESIGDKGSI